jgi:hypothetical protein
MCNHQIIWQEGSRKNRPTGEDWSNGIALRRSFSCADRETSQRVAALDVQQHMPTAMCISLEATQMVTHNSATQPMRGVF